MQPWKHSTKHLSDLLLFKHLLQEPQPTIRGKGTDFILYGTALYGELQQKKKDMKLDTVEEHCCRKPK